MLILKNKSPENKRSRNTQVLHRSLGTSSMEPLWRRSWHRPGRLLFLLFYRDLFEVEEEEEEEVVVVVAAVVVVVVVAAVASSSSK